MYQELADSINESRLPDDLFVANYDPEDDPECVCIYQDPDALHKKVTDQPILGIYPESHLGKHYYQLSDFGATENVIDYENWDKKDITEFVSHLGYMWDEHHYEQDNPDGYDEVVQILGDKSALNVANLLPKIRQMFKYIKDVQDLGRRIEKQVDDRHFAKNKGLE